MIEARGEIEGAEKLYLIVPEPLMGWMKFHLESDLVEVISTQYLNPEPDYHY